jgi:hypothetical protein
MDDKYDLVSAMLAMALCAALLVTGQQYIEKHPEAIAAASSPARNVVASGSSSHF